MSLSAGIYGNIHHVYSSVYAHMCICCGDCLMVVDVIHANLFPTPLLVFKIVLLH